MARSVVERISEGRLLACLLFLLYASGVAWAEEKKANAIVPPPRLNCPGRHVELSEGTLYVPNHFRPAKSGRADLVLFFHGAAWCAEQSFYAARKNAVLVSVSAKRMAEFGREGSDFTVLLKTLPGKLLAEGFEVKRIEKVCVASFSGGYVAVRNLLSHTQVLNQISDVVLADSLYAQRVPGKTNELDPAQMEPFLRYAQRAASGHGRFFFSHLYPPEERYRGNTTTLAASYLIERVKAKREPGKGRNSRGAELLYRADRGGFHVRGYAGMNNQDHFEHFYAIGDLLRETSLGDGEY